MGHRTWIYHKTEEPKIIDSDNLSLFLEDGWAQTPAAFINLDDIGIDSDDAIAVQNVGDTVQGIADSLNGALNIDTMDKDALEEYASEHYGVDLDKRNGVKKLRAEVQALVDGNSE